MTVSFIGVSYHSSRAAVEFANQIAEHCDSVLIVDNSNDDDQYRILSEGLMPAQASVSCIQAGDNLGYCGGYLLGVKQLLESGQQLSDWVVMSNVDITLTSGNIAEILDSYANDSTVGLIAPAVISTTTGKDLNPLYVNRPSRNHIAKLRWLLETYPTYLGALAVSYAKRKISRPSQTRATPSAVYAPHGSVIIINRRLLDFWDELESGPFLFLEEITLAECCRTNGLKVIYEPSLIFRHDEHISTGWIKSPTIWRHHRNAFRHILRKHY